MIKNAVETDWDLCIPEQEKKKKSKALFQSLKVQFVRFGHNFN